VLIQLQNIFEELKVYKQNLDTEQIELLKIYAKIRKKNKILISRKKK
jgi:hypothetical protein